MTRFGRLSILLWLCLVLQAPAQALPNRSAVLFIADGLGPAYVTATRLARGVENKALHLDAMPYTAIVKTGAADSPVTDSAAAATAMACGRKTDNGVLGQDATAVYGKSAGRTLESIATRAGRRGLGVGIVTTTRVTHATPAAFYASHHDRDREEEIARQALAADLDLLLGGGRATFRKALSVGESDLGKAVLDRGWRLATGFDGLQVAAGTEDRVLGLFSESHLPYEPERRKMAVEAAGPAGARGSAAGAPGSSAVPSLAEMTVWAIDRLKQGGRPFLLVVEGGRPDHAGHENWALTLLDEVAAFDDAVGAALARLDPATTMVLATGDHETGGLAISSDPGGGSGPRSADIPAGHVRAAPDAILTFATGPGTRQRAGRAPHGAGDLAPSTIHEDHASHTAVDVPLYAWGAGAEQVHGTLENTAIYFLLRGHFEEKPPARETLTRPGS